MPDLTALTPHQEAAVDITMAATIALVHAIMERNPDESIGPESTIMSQHQHTGRWDLESDI